MQVVAPGVILTFDLWYNICEEIFRSDRRQDLAALCLVSRQRHAAATPWLYRYVTLDFNIVKDPLLCFNNAKALPSRSVHSLSIQGLNTGKQDTELRRLAEVIPSLPNLQRFVWKSAELIPIRLMSAVQAHPRVRDIVVEPCLFVIGRDSTYTFDPNRILLLAKSAPDFNSTGLTPVKRIVDIQANLDDVYLAGYRFPPGIDALYYIDSARLRRLDLNSCTDIGYLFGGLLDQINVMQLKVLLIGQPQSQIGAGYVGKENIERFLRAYRGLEEMVFTNLGQNRPCLPAILAQGQTLKVLKLRESSAKHSNGAEKRETVNEVEDLARIYHACPQLTNLVVDQSCGGCGRRQYCLEGNFEAQDDTPAKNPSYIPSPKQNDGRAASHTYSVKVITQGRVDCRVCVDCVSDCENALEDFRYSVT